MFFSQRGIRSVLSLLLCVCSASAAEVLRRDSYGGSGRGSLVQPRLEQLTLSPDFKITDKPTTRTYDWTITQEEGAPDGFYRQMLVVNGGCLVISTIFLTFMWLKQVNILDPPSRQTRATLLSLKSRIIFPRWEQAFIGTGSSKTARLGWTGRLELLSALFRLAALSPITSRFPVNTVLIGGSKWCFDLFTNWLYLCSYVKVHMLARNCRMVFTG